MTRCFTQHISSCVLVVILYGFRLPIVTSYIEVGEAASADIELSVISSCLNSATLSWTCCRQGQGELNVKMCELTHYRAGQHKTAKIIDINPDSRNHRIELPDLLVGQSYTVFLVCDGTMKTNEVNFVVGGLCVDVAKPNHHHNATTSKVDEPNNSVQIYKTHKVSAVDWLSAVIFSCLGITLIVVVGYYTWKKYQHRRRILRIFRHEQNDPFQSLYSPSQDSYNF